MKADKIWITTQFKASKKIIRFFISNLTQKRNTEQPIWKLNWKFEHQHNATISSNETEPHLNRNQRSEWKKGWLISSEKIEWVLRMRKKKLRRPSEFIRWWPESEIFRHRWDLFREKNEWKFRGRVAYATECVSVVIRKVRFTWITWKIKIKKLIHFVSYSNFCQFSYRANGSVTCVPIFLLISTPFVPD